MPGGDQRVHALAGTGAVVYGDRVPPARRAGLVVGQYVGHGFTVELVEHGALRGVRDGQHHAVHAVAQQVFHALALAGGVVAAGHQHQRIAGGQRDFLDPGPAFGEHGVFQRGQHHAQDAGLLRAQLGAEQVGAEGEPARGVVHALGGALAHQLRMAEHARGRGQRDVSGQRHVCQRHAIAAFAFGIGRQKNGAAGVRHGRCRRSGGEQ
ncbi:hypothetical protein D3C81_1373550 [compost metagenome]